MISKFNSIFVFYSGKGLNSLFADYSGQYSHIFHNIYKNSGEH